jgi:triphosphatase
MRDDHSWVSDARGAVRDLDVQLEQLAGWQAELPDADRKPLGALTSLLEVQRRDARAALLEALDSPRYEAFVGRFGRTLRARRRRLEGRAALPARAVAPDPLEARYRRLRRRGDQPSGA